MRYRQDQPDNSTENNFLSNNSTIHLQPISNHFLHILNKGYPNQTYQSQQNNSASHIKFYTELKVLKFFKNQTLPPIIPHFAVG